MSRKEEDRYVCVHCGTPVNKLYKWYSPSVLKLVHCNNCNRIADEYVEYDNVIVVIDIILFSRPAYQHLLYNSDFQNHWKLALLILLVKSFDEWMFLKVAPIHKEFSNRSEILTEQKFYNCCFITITGKLLFFVIILTLYMVYWKSSCLNVSLYKYLKVISKALITSNFGHFLLLPSLIWSDFHREIHLIFISTYLILSQIQALAVVSSLRLTTIAAVLICATAADFAISHYLRSIL